MDEPRHISQRVGGKQDQRGGPCRLATAKAPLSLHSEAP